MQSSYICKMRLIHLYQSPLFLTFNFLIMKSLQHFLHINEKGQLIDIYFNFVGDPVDMVFMLSMKKVHGQE